MRNSAPEGLPPARPDLSAPSVRLYLFRPWEGDSRLGAGEGPRGDRASDKPRPDRGDRAERPA
jgi:hypothetical protein